MRIRSIGFLLTASIAVITLSGMAVLYGQQRSRLARLDEAKSLVRVVGHVNRFVEAMALERGAYNQILVSTETSPERIEALAGPRVTMTDGIFLDTEEALSALPLRLTRYFGREAEIEALCTLVSPGSTTRLVTILGTGGMGKTRLAVRMKSVRFE